METLLTILNNMKLELSNIERTKDVQSIHETSKKIRNFIVGAENTVQALSWAPIFSLKHQSIFSPVLFISKEDLFAKSAEIGVEQINSNSLVNCFLRVSGKICRTSNSRLFYLKCSKCQSILEDLEDHGFLPSMIQKNLFLSVNEVHGAQLFIELKNR